MRVANLYEEIELDSDIVLFIISHSEKRRVFGDRKRSCYYDHYYLLESDRCEGYVGLYGALNEIYTSLFTITGSK